MKRCLVRGSGDIGSAVAHALFRAGFAVAIHDVPAPVYSRRGRAFVDALFDSRARLDGVEAVACNALDAFAAAAESREAIAITALPFEAVLRALHPDVLVDARMRKREVPEGQRGLAPLTIGLGPNFVAGGNVDVVVETAWGDDLGKVIRHGASAAFTGIPRVVDGHGRDRYVYAPVAGEFRCTQRLGVRIPQGAEVGRIDDTLVTAPLAGTLVAVTRSGAPVAKGAKIVEIDPRDDPALAFGIGERARAVARGVLAAVEETNAG